MATAAAKGTRATVRTRTARVGQPSSTRRRQRHQQGLDRHGCRPAEPLHALALEPAWTASSGAGKRPPRRPAMTASAQTGHSGSAGPLRPQSQAQGQAHDVAARRRPAGSAGSSRRGSRTGRAWRPSAAGPRPRARPKWARDSDVDWAGCPVTACGIEQPRRWPPPGLRGRHRASTTRGWRFVRAPEQGRSAPRPRAKATTAARTTGRPGRRWSPRQAPATAAATATTAKARDSTASSGRGRAASRQALARRHSSPSALADFAQLADDDGGAHVSCVATASAGVPGAGAGSRRSRYGRRACARSG